MPSRLCTCVLCALNIVHMCLVCYVYFKGMCYVYCVGRFAYMDVANAVLSMGTLEVCMCVLFGVLCE